MPHGAVLKFDTRLDCYDHSFAVISKHRYQFVLSLAPHMQRVNFPSCTTELELGRSLGQVSEGLATLELGILDGACGVGSVSNVKG